MIDIISKLMVLITMGLEAITLQKKKSLQAVLLRVSVVSSQIEENEMGKKINDRQRDRRK